MVVGNALHGGSAVSDLGLTHVALPVSDLDESIAFYAEYAAMQVVHRRAGVVWLSDKTRPFVIVLMETGEIASPLRSPAHLGVACESRAAIDRLCERARVASRLLEGPRDHGPPVGYWAFIADPDGHVLEVSHGQDVGLAVERAG
jgi:catechol 2,3-dioxygenase-like lactoylglutathione lyase family enzyme